MPNATNLLQATISSTDGNNLIPINRSLNNPSFQGAFAELASFLNLPTSGVDAVISMPGTPVLQAYVKNLAAVGSGINITVKWTPNGGAQATVIVLAPQSIILFWELATAGTLGISAMSLNPSANVTPCEIFLGG